MADQEKTKKKGAGLNVVIAQTHRLGGQLTSLQMTSGNLLAVGLSACQITGGVTWLLVLGKMAWYVIPFIGILTMGLAIVIERLSLGGLSIVRGASRQLNELEEQHHMMLLHENRSATEIETYEYNRRSKKLKKSRAWSIPIIILGVIISGCLGDVMWHEVFASTGPVVSVLLSLCCAVPISLTFVFSEIYKDLSDDTLKETISDDSIQQAVLEGAERDIQVSLAMEAFTNVRSDPKKHAEAIAKIEGGLLQRLEAFATRASLSETEQAAVAGAPANSIPLPQEAETKQVERAERNRWKSNSEKFFIFMDANSKATLVQIMTAFGVQRTTASEWRARYQNAMRMQAGAQTGQQTGQGETQPDLNEERQTPAELRSELDEDFDADQEPTTDHLADPTEDDEDLLSESGDDEQDKTVEGEFVEV